MPVSLDPFPLDLDPHAPIGSRVRRADLGDGTYRNPVVPGDRPDPSILKDGEDYYLTFSSFLAYPGLVIWHSTDLVNWRPVAPALKTFVGSVWAPDLVKHRGRYYLYLPAQAEDRSTIFVITADDIRGPWTEPVDLNLGGCIDPGHAVGEDGRRYLFVNGIRRVALTDDGLATDGPLEQVYQPWRYPDDWVVEMFAPEGPKVARHGEFFYLVSAVGGTAGPATSHMVIAARSRSIHEPWEDCPHNPVVRTWDEAEPWWSRGHASLVEGPAGDWWMVSHGYENGYRTLGRQTLLEPIEWTPDGWFRSQGGDLSLPLTKPAGGRPSLPLTDLSDDFTADRTGTQWTFFHPGPRESDRLTRAGGTLVLAGRGTSPADTSPLTFLVPDRDYLVEVVVDLEEAQGGLLLYYSERMFCGLGFDGRRMITYHYGQEHPWLRTEVPPGPVALRMECRSQVASFAWRTGDGPWTRHPWQMEVSGMNHNVFGGFTSLKVGLFALGSGRVLYRSFVYRGLPAA